MFKKVLVPLDGSALAERALEPALTICRAARGEVRLLSVPYLKHAIVEERSGYGVLLPHQSIELTRQELRDYQQGLAEKFARSGIKLHTSIKDGDEAGVIVETAVSEEVDLIVMSTHGRTGFARWYLGSITERVLPSAPCPVLIVRETRPYEKMMITLDGSTLSERALAPGFALANCFDTAVTLFSVTQLEFVAPDFVADLEAVERGLGLRAHASIHFRTEQYLERIALECQHLSPRPVQIKSRPGQVARTILQAVESEEVDLVVMATHGRTGLSRWAYGSITEKVLRHAKCDLLIIRPSAEAFSKK